MIAAAKGITADKRNSSAQHTTVLSAAPRATMGGFPRLRGCRGITADTRIASAKDYYRTALSLLFPFFFPPLRLPLAPPLPFLLPPLPAAWLLPWGLHSGLFGLTSLLSPSAAVASRSPTLLQPGTVAWANTDTTRLHSDPLGKSPVSSKTTWSSNLNHAEVALVSPFMPRAGWWCRVQ